METLPAKVETNATRQVWIEYSPTREGKVMCNRCGKVVGHQRIARGAHASWHLKQDRLSQSNESTTA